MHSTYYQTNDKSFLSLSLFRSFFPIERVSDQLHDTTSDIVSTFAYLSIDERRRKKNTSTDISSENNLF